MKRKHSKVNKKNFLEKVFASLMTLLIVFNMCSLNFLVLAPVAQAAEDIEIVTEKEEVEAEEAEEEKAEAEEEEEAETEAEEEEADEAETEDDVATEEETTEEETVPAEEETATEEADVEEEATEEEDATEEADAEEEATEETDAEEEATEEEDATEEADAEEEATEEEADTKEEAAPEEEKSAPKEEEEAEEEEITPEWEMSDNDKIANIGPVEKDVKYIAPQNDQVTVTFTKLPKDIGDLTIEEVTLTNEQVEELGALSNKAYDITSSMKNGTFEYDLTLPKPKEVEEVQIKYAESEDELDDIKTIEDVDTKDDKVKADGVDHFTLFIVTADLSVLSVTPTINNASSVAVNSGTIVKAKLKVGIPWLNSWVYTKYKIGSGPWKIVNTTDHSNLSWRPKKPVVYSEEFDITAPAAEGSYNIKFRACGLLHCSNRSILRAGIIVDDTKPQASIVSPTHGQVVQGTFNVNGTASDGESSVVEVKYTVTQVSAIKGGYVDNVSSGTATGTTSWDFDVVGLSEGFYRLKAQAFDEAGNDRYTNYHDVEVDNTAPAMPTGLRRIAPNENGKIYECGDVSRIQKMWPDWDDNTEADFSHYEYSSFNPGSQGLDEKEFPNSIFKYNGSWLPGEGTYGFAVRAVDNVGNKSDWALIDETLAGSCQITFDSTAPVVEITNPTVSLLTGSVEVRGTVTDDHPHHYWLHITKNGNQIVSKVVNRSDSFTDELLYTLTQDGNYVVTLAARDAVGGTSKSGNRSLNVVKSFTIDNTKPASTIDGGADNERVYINSWDGNISGTATDNLSGVAGVKVSVQRASDDEYWNGAAWIASVPEVLNDATGTTTWIYDIGTQSEDIYTIKSHAVDNAGNVENTYTLTIVFDKTIPTVSLSIDPGSPNGDNGWYDSKPTITLKATDTNLDKIEYQIDSKTGSWTTYTGPVSIDDGKHIFYYRSLDLAANYSDIGVKNVKVDTEDPDEISNLDAEYDSNVGAVRLTWDADGDVDKVYIYRGKSRGFDPDSGNRLTKQDGDDETFSDYDVNLGDEYYYKIIALDEAGNRSDAKRILIIIPENEDEEAIVVVDEGTEGTGGDDGSGSGGGDGEGSEDEGGANEEGDDEEGIGNGNLAGASFAFGDILKSPFLWIILLLIIGGYIYYSRKKKQQ